MPKLGMQPIRRRQLIEATIAAIHAHGLGETTVARISAAAGVSSGIVHHYFAGKDALLAATMRALLADLRASVAARLADADDARARVAAIIDGNFAHRQFAPETVTAWLAFWAEVPHSPALARLQRINAGRLRSNLRHALRQLMPAPAAVRTAAGSGALIDGLWLAGALAADGIDPAAARAIARDYFEASLPADVSSKVMR